MERAKFEELEDGTVAGEVPGLQGVLANAPTEAECRDQLPEVIEEWVLVRVARGLDIPAIDGVTVSVTPTDA